MEEVESMPKVTEKKLSEAAILERLIAPKQGSLAPEAARSVLDLRFHPDDIRRMNDLAAKAREGSLSAAEQKLLASYERIGHLVNYLQAKARRSLKG
jgi:hypothetical protein